MQHFPQHSTNSPSVDWNHYLGTNGQSYLQDDQVNSCLAHKNVHCDLHRGNQTKGSKNVFCHRTLSTHIHLQSNAILWNFLQQQWGALELQLARLKNCVQMCFPFNEFRFKYKKLHMPCVYHFG